MSLYVGLMSGTSMDGIDAALVSIESANQLKIIHSIRHSWPETLVDEFRQLATPQENEIDRMGKASAWAGEIFADAVRCLLEASHTQAEQVSAIGSHGQTIRHHPQPPHAFSLQIGDPHRIAELTGIDTIADFRNRDIAAGGQGAPLVPAFHQAMFANTNNKRVILNIGGIANITILDNPVSGFDTGPGNRLLDDWIQLHHGLAYDKNGSWAAQGKVSPQLLDQLLSDPYFNQPPPKSTGSEYFNIDWLQAQLKQLNATITPADVQATLVQLTVQSISGAIQSACPNCSHVIVCGGGAHNATLMQSLGTQFPDAIVDTTTNHGMHVDDVEAAAFAWLAWCFKHGRAGNLPAVTGASQPAILGCLYPGN